MTAGTEALRWMKRQERRCRWQRRQGTTRKQVEIKGIKVTRLRQIQAVNCSCAPSTLVVNSCALVTFDQDKLQADTF